MFTFSNSCSTNSSSAGSSPGSQNNWSCFGGEDYLQQIFPMNPSLVSEFERLFVTEPPKSYSCSSASESDSNSEDGIPDFHTNGISRDIDDFDRILAKPRPTRAEQLGLGLRYGSDKFNDDGEVDQLTKEGLLALLKKGNQAHVRTMSKRGTVCVFCRNNGESDIIYLSHNLKDGNGRVTCPVLRAYTCPNCGANGDNAHTIKYCPSGSADLTQTSSVLKTARLSCGRKRAIVTSHNTGLHITVPSYPPPPISPSRISPSNAAPAPPNKSSPGSISNAQKALQNNVSRKISIDTNTSSFNNKLNTLNRINNNNLTQINLDTAKFNINSILKPVRDNSIFSID